MTETLLIRARLKRNPSIAAIASLLLPAAASAHVGAAHRLVWSLFAGDAKQQRSFLWREDQNSTFYILARQPPGASEIFDLESKVFSPNLRPGDFLEFSLRANPTRAYKPHGSKARGKRTDIVMAQLYRKHERAAKRSEIISEAGRCWLTEQGQKHGFQLAAAPRVDGYNKLQIPRIGGNRIEFSTLDFSGMLQVNDPAVFSAALLHGFGQAKAFGCGLMLIRRAG